MNKFEKTLCIVMCALPMPAMADVSMSAIFGDHMVLQGEAAIPVWGRADPGERVTVEIDGQTAETVAAADGKWRVNLPAPPISDASLELRVSGQNTLVFRDVLIGDVWVCSGQSNMSMGVGAMRDATAIVATADRPTLRLFAVERQVGFTPLEDCQGKWEVCTPESVLATGGWKGFSAVGYQFGAALHDHLQRPVGLIASSAGGTDIHTWSSLDSLKGQSRNMSRTHANVRRFERARDELPTAMKRYSEELLPAWEKERAEQQRPLQEWRQAVARARDSGLPPPPRPELAKISKHPPSPEKNFTLPTVLFNGMIAPLTPYGARGVIWYQGEADAYPGKIEEYPALLAAMIGDWRARWERAELPFLVVQLPNLENESDTWPLLREAQRDVLSLAATALVVSIDAGDPHDLHPADKTVIARRLALAARKVAYGEDVVHAGPEFSGVSVADDRVRITYRHAGGGLEIGVAPRAAFMEQPPEKSARLHGFEIAGADERFLPAEAHVEGDTVRVWNHSISEPRFVRYAWASNLRPMANLYNREGLPAAPFQAVIPR